MEKRSYLPFFYFILFLKIDLAAVNVNDFGEKNHFNNLGNFQKGVLEYMAALPQLLLCLSFSRVYLQI